jgi:hypothetical protein
MVRQEGTLVMLVQSVDTIPLPTLPARSRRGHPVVYADRLFLKALVVMGVKRLTTIYELLAVLEQDTPEMTALRPLLMQEGQCPSRRTWERRVAALLGRLPAIIGCLGRHLVAVLNPWRDHARAAAIDSTTLPAKGGVWHKKDRMAGVVPHTSIDTEAGWTKSGWHGWVYGWKLHLVCAAGPVWLPLAAELTPAPEADNAVAPRLIRELPDDLRFLLGDQHYRDADLVTLCAARSCVLVAPTGGPYPHTDDGVAVRRLLHPLGHHRDLQRAVQGHLRWPCPRPHAGHGRDPALRLGRHLCLSTRRAPASPARGGPAHRPQSLPACRLTIYDHASIR